VLEAGVHAEFSLRLTVGSGGIGTFDLGRDRWGMLSDERLAGAPAGSGVACSISLATMTRVGLIR